MVLTLVNRCRRLGLVKAPREILAKDSHEISAALLPQVIKDPHQGYQVECIRTD